MRNGSVRRIGFVTVGRSDHGIIGPVIRAMVADPRFDPFLIVTGDNNSDHTGLDAPVLMHVPVSYGQAGLTDMSSAMGQELTGIAEGFAAIDRQEWPEFIILTGDRFEMLAATAALVPLNIPLCHLHGGEASFGAIDDAIRHALTKLSHLHFTATQEASSRIRQLGEEAWRVTVSGAPALDNLDAIEKMDAAMLAKSLDFPPLSAAAPLLVTLHAETREGTSPRELAVAVTDALSSIDAPIVFTHPNADPGGREILAAIESFSEGRDNVCVVETLGTVRYFSLLDIARAMVGNSSSGLIEAPSFGLPVVNIGARQKGRQRGINVIDCEATRAAVQSALAKAMDSAFLKQARETPSPFGDGKASKRIMEVLAEVSVDQALLTKKFIDMDRESL